MKKVSFTEMKNGTKEDYLLLDKNEKDFASKTAERILKFLSSLTDTLEGYQISRLEHSLQSATRAYKANENEEMVEMLEASRQYQNNVEVVSTLRSLMMRTISMGK